MLRFFLFTFFVLTFTNTFSQVIQNDNNQFFVSLNDVSNDQLTVVLITPKFNTDKVSYKFPAMVPGTYKIYNFGRFISELQAYDQSGNALGVNKSDINTWEISDADKLYKIIYRVDDTFEDTTGNPVFEPVGTSIEEGKIFVVNNQGFFGYFEGFINLSYTISFSKPPGFFGSTSLTAIERTDTEEIYTSTDYQFLVDSPIFFNVPDTASINFEEASVFISVYSPTKSITAKDFAESNKELLKAIRTYLGGKLPTNKYTFLYYFSDNKIGSGSFGALEHNQSSLYYMPNVPKEAKIYMIEQLKSTNVHEFYHTVTPLNLHSEEIGNFDFNSPKMSRHLWLYEGVTEYHADYIQLREGLMSLEEYTKVIDAKLNGAARYNDSLPFTELSKGALDLHERQYNNVYEKGALIGLCLDILIREESDGKQGIQDVINRLQEKYGKDKSFRDDDLFGEIEALTSPKVREFLDIYVAGANRIPYEQIFPKIGFDLIRKPYQVVDAGGFEMGFNPEKFRLKIVKIENPENKFIAELGAKNGDELVSVGGKQINFQTMKSIFGSENNVVKPGDDFELVVARIDDNGNEKLVPLKAKILKTKTAYSYKASLIKNLTDSQQKIQKDWFGK